MAPIIRFEDYEIDTDRRELRRHGNQITIQPRPLALLTYLACHSDRVVSRDELFSEVWHGVAVNDEAIGFAVHQARRAVADNGIEQRVIKTVSRSGFRFVADRDESAVGALSGPRTFVGRRSVLKESNERLLDVGRGDTSLLLLGGEAGIGKTRTANEIAYSASSSGFSVYAARCIEVEGSPVYWPWIQLLRAVVQDLPESVLADALGLGAPELARLFPELHDLLPELRAARPPAPAAAQYLLYDSVSRLLRYVAKARRLLLLIDDIHRADMSSLLLLRDVISEVAGSRVRILCTLREAEAVADSERAEPIAEILRVPGVRLLKLTGLSSEEVREFIEVQFGREPSSLVVNDLHDRTNGNPFFLKQVLDVLHSAGRTDAVSSESSIDFELPRHANDAIAAQLSSLTEKTRSVLELGAVFGRDFSETAVSLASNTSRSEISRVLESAISIGVVCRTTHDQLRFSHVLLRDALYDRIEPFLRAQLHLRAGQALLSISGRDGREADLPTIAQHYYEGARFGGVHEALDYLLEAGRWAEERFAFDEAASILTRALELCLADPQVEDDRRCEILLSLGNAHTGAGHRDAARECFHSVARLARSSGHPEELAAAALRFAPDFLSIETGVCDEELIELLEDALASLPRTDSDVRARLLGRLAVALHWAPASAARIEELSQEAVEISERIGDAGALRYTMCARELAMYSVDNPERYIRAPNVAVVAGQSAAEELLEQLLHMTALMQCGRVDDFDHEIATFSDLSRRLRQPQAEWYVEMFRAMRAHFDGRIQDADLHTQAFLRAGQRVNDKNAIQSAQILLLMLAIDRGPLEVLEASVVGMIERFPAVIGWRSGVALFYSQAGRVDDAWHHIDRALELGVTDAPKRNEWFAAVPALSWAAAEVGHERATQLTYELMEPNTDHLLVIGYSSFCWGPVALMRGIGALALRDWNSARQHIEAGVQKSRELGAKTSLARGLYYRARLEVDRGQPRSAKPYIDESRMIAERLGLKRLVLKLQAIEDQL